MYIDMHTCAFVCIHICVLHIASFLTHQQRATDVLLSEALKSTYTANYQNTLTVVAVQLLVLRNKCMVNVQSNKPHRVNVY